MATIRFLVVFVLLIGCGGKSSEVYEVVTEKKLVDEQYTNNVAIPNNTGVNSYQILFIGNSHTSPMRKLVTSLIEHGTPDRDITISVDRSPFLADSLYKESLLELFNSKSWSHVVLQGQKYSQSGSVNYPTDAAKKWIQRAKAQDATPILFPEHPQKDNYLEGQYVHNIHTQIAREEASCVAPVGLTWNRVLQLKPNLDLHSSDGNHASELGSLLTAFVIYQVITGQSADLIPYIEELNADQETQAFFGQITSEVISGSNVCSFTLL